MRDYLQHAAWRFILDQNINSLPVDPFRIARKNGWIIYTYEEFATLVNKSVETLISRYENDGFAFWSRRDGCFIICYNSTLPFSVCRWTLLHEMAHIYLKHISSENPLLSRVRTQERSLLEVEAQGFARRVLCPSIVLHNCKAFEPEEIMRLCGISREAAGYRSDYIKKLELRGKFRVDPLEIQVEDQFFCFVRKYNIQKLKRITYNFLFEIAGEISA
ncbi:MAG: ImmA/IrrE family metallo-endopeptidase [Anaerotignum propionicum]|uniref:ImmA/IrrE family metallo-endopeptidase n=1 Tax=Anaerotignum propionicum TaxID=28446 RepID=UPI002B1F10A5|nr:ImmA/IrrE family metallo-endopeptidase [Anaerotignum propionicum]MEA5057736.1 ImmA/IrrE family metallo-endopeptidase [Anaerotignum propionicum]